MGVLSAHNLKGIWGTVLLPLNKDDSIDYACLKEDLDYICRSGVDGIYTNGTAGEFFNQSEEEFEAIQQLVAEKCREENLPFQIGVSHSSPLTCLERITKTASLKPDAYQVIFPDWLPLVPEEQVAFLKKVAAQAGPVPLVLYNPGHAKTALQPQDFAKLYSEIPELIGVKVAAKDADWFEKMRAHSTRLAVFIQGHRLATGFREKVASGSYSNMACFNPAGAAAWYRVIREDPDEALTIEMLIGRFFEACIFPFAKSGYPDPALDKLLAFAGGWSRMDTRLRWPYRSVGSDEALRVRKQAKKMLPEIVTGTRIFN